MTAKKWIISLGIVAALGGSTAAFAAGASGSGTSAASSTSNIGLMKAKEIALQKVAGTLDSIELEHKHGKAYYEVEIVKADRTESEVHVDAATGKVLKVIADDQDDYGSDRDVYRGGSHAKPDKASGAASGGNQKPAISEQQAVQIATKAVNGQVTKIELDHEDGKLQYELDLKTGRGEAEVELSAADGTILSIDYDDQD